MKEIILTILFLTSISFGANAKEIWLNDLDCSSYGNKSECIELGSILNETELSSFEQMTFDNQLKKITHLMHKDKIKIAEKRYDYFLNLLRESVPNKTMKKIEEKKETIWNILLNYSKSTEYTPNPKYKV
tara:strand:- start:138841 stop:139230 length:390 start_codon:yes stop_codon:yes gene_type:complete